MKKILPIIFGVVLFVSTVNLHAQEPVRSLIFSEWAGINRYNNYVELTNVGPDTIDLSEFTLACFNQNHQFVDDGGEIKISMDDDRYKLRLSGKLAPDSSLLFMNVFDGLRNDGLTYHRMEMLGIADEIVHYDNVLENLPTVIDPERELWGFDSLSVHHYVMRLMGGLFGNLLFYHLPGGDSVLVDQVKLNLNANLQTDMVPSDVAGIYQATASHILVRKANIASGNPDWDASRGADATDSEWLPIPMLQGDKIYSTVRTHGDFGIELSSETININPDDSTLVVPWGIYKGESIIDELTLGDGVGWQYIQDTTSVEDSAHVIVQTGDILQIFACGNDLDWIDFKMTTADPGSDMARVFPLSYQYYPDPEDPAYFWTTPYYVTEGEPVIDTIGNVLFQTRVDTLLKYIEMAPESSWEIIWIDGTERVDLKRGDILKVTAEDNITVKEYFIDVHDYYASGNALLAAITWPDKSEFLDGWMGDTVPMFSSGKTLYSITLPYGTVSVPAFSAVPQDINARITETRAVNLTGDQEQRSTVFTVIAEDDSTEMAYTVTFVLEMPDANIQKFYGDPFISELVTAQWGIVSYIEVVNPRNVPLDLSEYLFVNSTLVNPGEALTGLVPDIPTENDFKFRYRGYVPGYLFHDDTLGWLNNPGMLVQDISVNPVLDPGDVFVALTAGSIRDTWVRDRTPLVWAEIDKVWGSTVDLLGADLYSTFSTVKRGAEAIYVFKITNPAVLDGTKAVGDPLDYELVDVFGDANADGIWQVADHSIPNVKYKTRIGRKPYVYQGVTNVGEGMGTNVDDSDWIVQKNPEDIPNQQDLNSYIGSHAMNPVTVYMSTVSSLTFLVSDGYVSPQTIQGDLTGMTVSDFYDNIQKADTGQVFSMISHPDGLAMILADPVGDSDTLVVTSADGNNVTKYALIDLPLDDNALIVVKPDYTSSITVAVDGTEGTITGSGVMWGGALKEVMAALEVPALATFSVIDQEDNLVSMQIRNSENLLVDTEIHDSIFIEVVAQNGINTITYQLQPASGSSDAFVISSVYEVNQEVKNIANILDQTSVVTLLDNVVPATGASLKVIDKAGNERSMGIVSYDDLLVVTSEDGSSTVNYYLNFLYEMNPDVPNQAPVVTIVADATAQNGTTISVTADVTDDGLPEGSVLTYLWEVTAGDDASVTIASADQVTTDVTFSKTGEFELSLTVSDGELSTPDVYTITVTPGVGIGMFNMSAISIFPNPANQMIYVEFGEVSQVESQIRIVDMIGKVAYLDNHFDTQVRISLEAFDAGIYFMIINVDNQSTIRKLNILK